MPDPRFTHAVVSVDTNEIKGGLWTSSRAAEKVALTYPGTYLVVHVSHLAGMGVELPKAWR